MSHSARVSEGGDIAGLDHRKNFPETQRSQPEDVKGEGGDIGTSPGLTIGKETASSIRFGCREETLGGVVGSAT